MVGPVNLQSNELAIEQDTGSSIGSVGVLVLLSALLMVLFSIFLFVYNLSLKNQISDLGPKRLATFSNTNAGESKNRGDDKFNR